MATASPSSLKLANKKKPVEVTIWQKGQPIQKKRLRDKVDVERHLAFYDRGPGAAGYILPPLLGKRHHDLTHLIEPEYTMRPFLQSSFLIGGVVGPGTGYYKIPDDFTHKGKAPHVSQPFGRRLKTTQEMSKEGPSLINLPHPDVYLFRSQKCLIMPYRSYPSKTYGGPLYLQGPMLGPKVVSRIAAQAVTMKGPFKHKKLGETGPGPASYDDLKPNRYPAWTIRGRLPPPKDASNMVGPKYSLEHIKNGPQAPAWKLGQRYNEFTGILRTPCDAVDYRNLDKLY